MQSRDARFWLLFESGPRDGERVALPLEASTLGRSETNSIVLTHGSVSGKHAVLLVSESGVVLRDAGSRNGTRVEGSKIAEQKLGHGDRIQFGSVRARFQDDEFAAADAPAGARTGTEALGRSDAALGAGAALDTVSTDALARSGSRSKLWIALVVVALGGLGFLGWRSFGPTPAGESRAQFVPEVAGNLLSNASFEDDEAQPWDAAEAASQAFFVDSGFARSGGLGLGVLLAEDEWAFARSGELRLADRKSVELECSLRVTGSATLRVGLQLGTQDDSEPSIHAWAPAVSGAGGAGAGSFTSTTLAFDVPAGFTRARVLVAGRGSASGSAQEAAELSVDDVSVVQAAGGVGDSVAFEEYELTVLGAEGTTAILSRSGRVLFTGISLASWDAGGLSGWTGGGWRARATETGFLLELTGSPPADARCELVAFRTRPLVSGASDTPWLATFGSSGYRSHAPTFEREGATDLLLGGGSNMLRLRASGSGADGTGGATTVRGLTRGEDAVLVFGMGAATGLEIQLSFDEERAAAERLALAARSAAASGEPGAALAAWGELLDEWAFDAALIGEAEAVRGDLLRSGHARLEALELALDSADFFRLRDGYLRCRDGVRALASDFEGTELRAKAAELEARIRAALSTLEADHAGSDVQRLQGVLAALSGSEDSALFDHVRAQLAEHAARSEATRTGAGGE